MLAWNEFQNKLREKMPPKQPRDLSFYRGMEFLAALDRKLPGLYADASNFRNELVHGISTPDPDRIEQELRKVLALRDPLARV